MMTRRSQTWLWCLALVIGKGVSTGAKIRGMWNEVGLGKTSMFSLEIRWSVYEDTLIETTKA